MDVIVKPHLMNHREKRAVIEGQTILQMVESTIESSLLYYVKVFVNNFEVKPNMWAKIKPKQGAEVLIAVVPQGGGDNKIGRMVMMAVIVVASVYTAGAAAGWAASEGMSASASMAVGAVAGMAVTTLGGMLSNAIFPPPALDTGMGEAGTKSPTYSVTGQRNKARPYDAIMSVYGMHRVSPDMAANPYVTNIGDKQMLTMLYDFGYGDVEVTDLRIGTTQLSKYKNKVFKVHRNVKSPNLRYYTGDRQSENFGINLQKNVPHVVTSSADADQVILNVSFPQGLCTVDSKGKVKTHTEIFTLEYSESGANNWIGYQDGGTEVDFSHDSMTSDEITFDMRINGTLHDTCNSAFEDDFDCQDRYMVPAGSTQLNIYTDVSESIAGVKIKLESGTYYTNDTITGGSQTITLTQPLEENLYTESYILGEPSHSPYIAKCCKVAESQFVVKDATTTPFVAGVSIDLPARGQYDFRLKRVTADSSDLKVSDTCVLSELQSIKHDSPVHFKEPHTVLELRIRADEQLNGVVDTISAMCRRRIQIWNGSSFVNAYTNNPAQIALHVLRNAKKPIPDARIDLVKFKEWADYCDEVVTTQLNGQAVAMKRWTCNVVFDYKTTLKQAFDSIASSGAASKSVIDGKYSVIIDKPDSSVKQMFTARNSKDFRGIKQFANMPDAVLVKFVDPDSGWTLKDVTVYRQGYNKTTARNIETLETFGVTSYALAYKYGLYALAQGEFRKETFEVTTDIENLVSTRGDVVEVQNSVPKVGGIPARVIGIDGRNVQIDEWMDLDSEKSYSAKVRLYDGSVSTFDILSSMPESNTVTASNDLSGVEIGDLIVIGETYLETDKFRIASITPGVNFEATIGLEPYREDFYLYETGVVADYEPQITEPLFSPKDISPTLFQTFEASDGNLSINLGATWDSYDKAQIYDVYLKINDGDYKGVGQTEKISFNINLPYSRVGDTCQVKVIAITAAGNSRPLAEASSTQITLSALSVAPPTFDKIESGSDHLTVNADGSVNTRIYAKVNQHTSELVDGYEISFKKNGESEFTSVMAVDMSGYRDNVLDGATYTIRARAIAGGTVYSDYVIATHQAVGKRQPPDNVANFTAEISDRSILLKWDAVDDADLREYELRYGGTDWDDAELITTAKTTSWVQKAATTGVHVWRIKAVDTSGNYSIADAHVNMIIDKPGKPSVTSQVIDNNVLLYWESVRGTLPIETYKMYRNGSYIGSINAGFTPIFETQSGLYTYKIIAVDIAGNESEPGQTTSNVSEPPDYVLNVNWDDDFSGTMANAQLVDGVLVLPINTAETYEEHFANNAFSSPQDQIDAGYEYYPQPSLGSASYEQDFDYGSILPSTLITLTTTSAKVDGEVNVTPTISISEDGVDYTDYPDQWQVYGTNFRYVKIRLDYVASGGDDLETIQSINVKLDSKIKNDGGTGFADKDDTNGTKVEFNTSFIDVTSLTVTPNISSGARSGLFDYEDTPEGREFYVYLFDETGARKSGEFSWSAKGY